MKPSSKQQLIQQRINSVEEGYSNCFLCRWHLWCSIKVTNFTVFPDKQEREALNQDKDVDYNLDENEAESETDKQAALAEIETGRNFLPVYHMLQLLRWCFARQHPVADDRTS